MTGDRPTIGPIRPVTPLRIALLVGMAAAGLYSYRVNIDIDSFYCDVDDIGARGACAELRDWITAHAGIVLLQFALSILLCLTRNRSHRRDELIEFLPADRFSRFDQHRSLHNQRKVNRHRMKPVVD